MSFLVSTKKLFLDLLFPSFCLSCRKEGVFLCEDCLDEIELLLNQLCPHCERKLSRHGKRCKSCSGKNAFQFSQLIVTAKYEKVIPRMVKTLKYKFARELSFSLGKIMTKSLQNNLDFVPDFLVPVPLHAFRLRWRGFNQSELLANHLSENLIPGLKNIPVKNLLERHQKTEKNQAEIKNYGQRMKNVEGIFQLSIEKKDFQKYQGKKILLVDDICTTGATLSECAKELKKLNPKKIACTVVARQGVQY